jgi:RNA-binding protein 26
MLLSYADNGYCARGAFCKYSHGEDAVVPEQLFPMNGMAGAAGYGPMMGPGEMAFPMAGSPNAQYNPHERIDMRPLPGGSMGIGTGRLPHSRAPMLPRNGDANGTISRKPGELPVIQDLTPQGPEEEGAAEHGAASMNGHIPGLSNIPSRPIDLGLPINSLADMRNGYRQGGRNGLMTPKGTFGEAPSFRGERRNDKTLVVEKIPEDKLSLGSINDWFKRFGTVTNVAVDAAGAKALVSFANHEEAHAAWKSEDAVFGNRFVKVFWHRPMEGHGQIGSRMLAASAPLVAKVAGKDSLQSAKPLTPASASPAMSAGRKPTPSSAASALAAKQQLLQKQIAEQKSLMERLSSASAEEKKDIMARLRKLNEEMKPASTASASSPSSTSAQASRGSTPRADDRTQKELERLDKELEIHHVSTAVKGEAEETTEELKARLEKLKAEVSSLFSHLIALLKLASCRPQV